MKNEVLETKPKLDPHQRLWTKDEAMEFMQIKKTLFNDMFAAGEIPHLYIGDLARFIPEQMWAWAKKKSAS
jgi:hypothetical protein